MKKTANWLTELPPVIKKSNNTIHKSNKTTFIQTSTKSNEKSVFDNLQDERQEQKPHFEIEDLDKTSDFGKKIQETR